jgi:hypothetical protein
MGDQVNNILSWQDLFMLPVKPFEYFWFLYVLILIFCIVEIADYLFKNDFMVFLLLFCVTISNWYLPSDIFIIDKTLNMMIYFYIAKLLQKNIGAIQDKRIILLAIVVFISLHYYNKYTEDIYTGLNFIIAVSITIPVLAICSQMKTDNRYFHYFAQIGRQTMPVYILHVPIASAVRMALLKTGMDNLLLHFVIGITIAWFASIYIYRLASKNKYADFLFYPLKYINLQ